MAVERRRTKERRKKSLRIFNPEKSQKPNRNHRVNVEKGEECSYCCLEMEVREIPHQLQEESDLTKGFYILIYSLNHDKT